MLFVPDLLSLDGIARETKIAWSNSRASSKFRSVSMFFLTKLSTFSNCIGVLLVSAATMLGLPSDTWVLVAANDLHSTRAGPAPAQSAAPHICKFVHVQLRQLLHKLQELGRDLHRVWSQLRRDLHASAVPCERCRLSFTRRPRDVESTTNQLW